MRSVSFTRQLAILRKVLGPSVSQAEVPDVVEKLIHVYLEHRDGDAETRRHHYAAHFSEDTHTKLFGIILDQQDWTNVLKLTSQVITNKLF